MRRPGGCNLHSQSIFILLYLISLLMSRNYCLVHMWENIHNTTSTKIGDCLGQEKNMQF